MLNSYQKPFIYPASDAGSVDDRSGKLSPEYVGKAFLKFCGLFGSSSLLVLKHLAAGDHEKAGAVLETLKQEKLIRGIHFDQEAIGEIIKLTRKGRDYLETVCGISLHRTYDTSSRVARAGFVPHDRACQLYVADLLQADAIKDYCPEMALGGSRRNKYFDVVVMTHDRKIVGLEIEKSPKYDKKLKAAMSRAILAIRQGDVDYVVFVLPSAHHLDRYDSVLDNESIGVLWESGRGWKRGEAVEPTHDEVMRIVSVVGCREMWKEAL